VPYTSVYTPSLPVALPICTEPQCLYSTAIPLLPLWAVRPVESLSPRTRMHFTFFYEKRGSHYCHNYYVMGLTKHFLKEWHIFALHVNQNIRMSTGLTISCYWLHSSAERRCFSKSQHYWNFIFIISNVNKLCLHIFWIPQTDTQKHIQKICGHFEVRHPRCILSNLNQGR
jgi:hypothetical protein